MDVSISQKCKSHTVWDSALTFAVRSLAQPFLSSSTAQAPSSFPHDQPPESKLRPIPLKRPTVTLSVASSSFLSQQIENPLNCGTDDIIMASATGIPDINGLRERETEPLLGRRGDASQMEGQPLYYNLWIGTAPIAQAGIWILAAIVWGAIFSHKLIFFSSHPLLNSAGLLLVTQAALILQPTHTPSQKRTGTATHFIFNLVGITALTGGLIIIEINKAGPGHEHFASPHAILGLLFYITIYLQALVGFTQYYTPALYGGVDNAKKVWKYHRGSGYAVATLGLATVCASSWTTYNLNVGHIQHWAVIVASVLVLVGLIPRIKLSKFGLKKYERLGDERRSSDA